MKLGLKRTATMLLVLIMIIALALTATAEEGHWDLDNSPEAEIIPEPEEGPALQEETDPEENVDPESVTEQEETADPEETTDAEEADVVGTTVTVEDILAEVLIVSFDYNGGEGAVESKEVIFDSAYGELPAAVRTDYHFDGWSTDGTLDGLVTAGTIVTIETDHTLTAMWVAVEDDAPPLVNGWYEIATADHLLWFAARVNDGDVAINGRLVAHIDASEVDYVPIGIYSTDAEVPSVPFTGSFDGSGYTVTLNLGGSGIRYMAMFSYVYEATISNLTVAGSVTGLSSTGGVVARAENSIIRNCVNEATISGGQGSGNGAYTGGVVANLVTVAGGTQAQIIDSVNRGTVRSDSYNVGGITGNSLGGAIIDCANSGAITGWYNVSGIAGGANNNSSIGRSYNAGYLTSTQTTALEYTATGGIVGQSSGNLIIDRCYNVGEIDSKNGRTGGILGYANGSDILITSSYNRAKIACTATNVNNYIGGIVGYAKSDVVVRNCYNSGLVSHSHPNETNKPIGGVIGYVEDLSAVSHNYYLEGVAVTGIKNEDDAADQVEVVSEAELQALPPNLGNAYKLGSTYPVLDWQPDEVAPVDIYTVAFDYNGGEGSVASKEVTLGSVYGELPEATHSEYSFGGWSTDGTPDGVVTAETVVSIASNHTLTALWVTENEVPPLVDGWYEIATVDHLLWFAARVNGGDAAINGKLVAHIDASEVAYTPIGVYSTDAEVPSVPFTGNFDGGGYVVTLNLGGSGIRYMAMFSYVQEATISNLKVSGSVRGLSSIGGVVSRAENSIIQNCINEATITGGMGSGNGAYAGGIVANLVTLADGTQSQIIDCINTGNVSSNSYNVGGITGNNIGSVVIDSANSADVTGRYNVGGIVGSIMGNSYGDAMVSRCFNVGIITSTQSIPATNTATGGIVGQGSGTGAITVDRCYNISGVYSANGRTGGIVGLAGSAGMKVTNCYNQAEVSCIDTNMNNYVGGVAGYTVSGATIENCYNSAWVDHSHPNEASKPIGGVIGYVEDLSTINNNYYLEGTAATGMKNLEDTAGKVIVVTGAELRALAPDLGDAYKVGLTYPILDWQPDEASIFVVTFDYNGGEGAVESKEVTWGSSYGALPEAARTNYIFEGWSTDGTPDGVVTAESVVSIEGDHTLVALWSADSDVPPLVSGWYEIANANQLLWFAELVNTGTNNTAQAKLVANIDLTDVAWTPIGRAGSTSVAFSGQFDGDGHTVTFDYDTGSDGAHYHGLIGYMRGSAALVKNVIIDGTITGAREYVGGVVGGVIDGKIENCVNNASIAGHSNVGGVVGFINGAKVTNCFNYGNVTAVANSGISGGVVGSLIGASAITGSDNYGQVSATAYAGGIYGNGATSYTSTITGCKNYGAIEAGNYAGGIAGNGGRATISQCLNAGTITASGTATGVYGAAGIVGTSSGSSAIVVIEQCYNSGDIKGAVGNVAGIAGYLNGNGSQITNSYNIGSVTSTNSSSDAKVGGIVARINHNNIAVTNCYNAGQVNGQASSSYVGSVFGDMHNSNNAFSNNYYLNGTSNKGLGNRDDAEGLVESVTAAQLRKLAPVLGEDYYKEGSYYPILRWQDDEPLFSDYLVSLVPELGASLDLNGGDMFSVDVIVSGDGSFSAMNSTVNYDPGLLTFVGVGNVLPGNRGGDDLVVNEATAGELRIIWAGYSAEEIGDGCRIITLSFQANRPTETGLKQATVQAKDAKITISGNPVSRDAQTGPNVLATVYNLTVTFQVGEHVTMADAVAYVRYNEAGLYTDNGYQEAFTIPTPVAEEGYRLADLLWSDGENSFSDAEVADQVFTSETILTAQVVKVWNVAFYDADGNQIGDSQMVDEGGYALAPDDPPAPIGMSFAGWFIVADVDAVYDGETLYSGAEIGELPVNADLLYKAYFDHESYLLTYDEAYVEIESGAIMIEDHAYATHDTDVVFKLKEIAVPAGYVTGVYYQVGEEDAVLLTADESGFYTIPGEVIVDEVQIIIRQLVDGRISFIEFGDYKAAPNGHKVLHLHLNTPAAADDVYLYGEDAMYWSEKYGAYVYFVEEDVTEDVAWALISITDSWQPTVTYGGDVNRDSKIDGDDIQLVFDLYTGLDDYLEDTDFQIVEMLWRLEADVNGDGRVDTLDERIIILHFLGVELITP